MKAAITICCRLEKVLPFVTPEMCIMYIQDLWESCWNISMWRSWKIFDWFILLLEFWSIGVRHRNHSFNFDVQFTFGTPPFSMSTPISTWVYMQEHVHMWKYIYCHSFPVKVFVTVLGVWSHQYEKRAFSLPLFGRTANIQLLVRKYI